MLLTLGWAISIYMVGEVKNLVTIYMMVNGEVKWLVHLHSHGGCGEECTALSTKVQTMAFCEQPACVFLRLVKHPVMLESTSNECVKTIL